MRKVGVGGLVCFLGLFLLSCGNEQGTASETGTDSLANDTMPVVYPKNFDSSRVVTPPPTNDDNNAYSDSTQPQ